MTVVRLPRMAPEVALEHLAALAALFDDGMCEPLPLACKTSAAYAEALAAGRSAKAATRSGSPTGTSRARTRSSSTSSSFGGVLPFEELLAAPRSTACARQLWDGAAGAGSRWSYR